MNEQPVNLSSPPNAVAPPPVPLEKLRKTGNTGGGFAWGCLTSLLLLFAGGAGLVLLASLAANRALESVRAVAEGNLTESFGRNKTDDVYGRIHRRVLSVGEGNREIAVIAVKGVIMNAPQYDQASAERIAMELGYARSQNNIVAVILDMDTPGGEVVASDEILQQVKLCRAAGKPVITCIRSLGASGGYFIASGSDWIITNRMSMTGSIGVLIGTVRINQMLDKIGVTAETYRSGNMKDMLSPTGNGSETEKRYVQELVDQTFLEFCQVVADGRESYADAESVRRSVFADGRILSGTDALRLGLIDELGAMPEAIAKARALAAAPQASVIALSSGFGWVDFLRSMRSAPTRIRLDGVTPIGVFAPVPGRLYYLTPDCY